MLRSGNPVWGDHRQKWDPRARLGTPAWGSEPQHCPASKSRARRGSTENAVCTQRAESCRPPRQSGSLGASLGIEEGRVLGSPSGSPSGEGLRRPLTSVSLLGRPPGLGPSCRLGDRGGRRPHQGGGAWPLAPCPFPQRPSDLGRGGGAGGPGPSGAVRRGVGNEAASCFSTFWKAPVFPSSGSASLPASRLRVPHRFSFLCPLPLAPPPPQSVALLLPPHPSPHAPVLSPSPALSVEQKGKLRERQSRVCALLLHPFLSLPPCPSVCPSVLPTISGSC